MNAQRLAQVGVIHLTVRLALDHDVARVLEAQNFGHAVMRVLAEVADAFGEQLTRHIEAVHVALRAAAGDVAPPFIRRRPREARKVRHDLPLKLHRVEPVVRAVKGIADVVDAKFEEAQQV